MTWKDTKAGNSICEVNEDFIVLRDIIIQKKQNEAD